MTHNPDHKAMLDDLLLGIPGVTGGQAFGYPAYKVRGKVFAFVGGAGIALKLPKARVDELVALGGPFRPFYPAEGYLWKSWVSIDREHSDKYRGDIALMEEAAQYVGDNA
jgi:hypothetical protein